MKIILSILCGTVILFIGGCAVTLGGEGGPIVWASWAIVLANLSMIVAIWGMPSRIRPLFIGMAVLDVVVALLLGGATLFNSGTDRELLFWGLLVAFAFLAKAGLSYMISKRI